MEGLVQQIILSKKEVSPLKTEGSNSWIMTTDAKYIPHNFTEEMKTDDENFDFMAITIYKLEFGETA